MKTKRGPPKRGKAKTFSKTQKRQLDPSNPSFNNKQISVNKMNMQKYQKKRKKLRKNVLPEPTLPFVTINSPETKFPEESIKTLEIDNSVTSPVSHRTEELIGVQLIATASKNVHLNNDVVIIDEEPATFFTESIIAQILAPERKLYSCDQLVSSKVILKEDMSQKEEHNSEKLTIGSSGLPSSVRTQHFISRRETLAMGSNRQISMKTSADTNKNKRSTDVNKLFDLDPDLLNDSFNRIDLPNVSIVDVEDDILFSDTGISERGGGSVTSSTDEEDDRRLLVPLPTDGNKNKKRKKKTKKKLTKISKVCVEEERNECEESLKKDNTIDNAVKSPRLKKKLKKLKDAESRYGKVNEVDKKQKSDINNGKKNGNLSTKERDFESDESRKSGIGSKTREEHSYKRKVVPQMNESSTITKGDNTSNTKDYDSTDSFVLSGSGDEDVDTTFEQISDYNSGLNTSLEEGAWTMTENDLLDVSPVYSHDKRKFIKKIDEKSFPFRVFQHHELDKYLIVLKESNTIPFMGKANIRAVCGTLIVNGFYMEPDNRWYPVYATKFNNIPTIQCHRFTDEDGDQDKIKVTISEMLLSTERPTFEGYVEDGPFAAFLVKEVDCHAWDYLAYCKIFGSLVVDVKYTQILGQQLRNKIFKQMGFYLCSGVNPNVLLPCQLRNLQGHEYAIGCITKSLGRFKKTPIIAICGQSGVGKSTFCRNLINRLLNESVNGICYLETDAGQTEFTPSCILSIHHITEPILAFPFLHQRKGSKMYFLGSNETKQSPDLYLEIVSSLYQYYLKTFPKKPLVINTNGWITGLGGALLLETLQMLMPTRIVMLQDPRSNQHLEFLRESCWRQDKTGYVDLTPLIMKVHAASSSDSRVKPAIKRDLALMGYFSALYKSSPTSSFNSLASLVPYVVPWSSVAIHLCNFTMSKQAYNSIMYALNTSIVGLCIVNPSEMVEIEGSRPSDRFPKILLQTPMCECLGLGIIRGIDPVAKVFYILTPVPAEDLSRVNALLKGTHSLPQSLLQQGFENQELPYVCTSYNCVIGSQPPKSRKYQARNAAGIERLMIKLARKKSR